MFLSPFAGDMGIDLPVSAVTNEMVREHREVERHSMHKLLDEYINICSQVGVNFLLFFIYCKLVDFS